MSDTTNFVEGELLEWRNRVTPDGQLTIRPVTFHGWKNHLAVVSFGLRSDGTREPNLYSVPRSELVRPVQRTTAPAVTLPEPKPSIPLEHRRHALRLRYQSFQEAEEMVNEATQLVERAQERVNHVQRELRNYADLEKHAIDAVVHELKFMNGGTLTHPITDDDTEWTNREKAQRDCQTAEAALSRFASELSHARSIAEERLSILHKAASFVLAGIVERETQRLAELESQAIRLRTVLRSAALMWLDGAPLPVGEPANKVLTAWPFDHEDPVGLRMQLTEDRQKPFMEIFTRLVNGEIDADLEV